VIPGSVERFLASVDTIPALLAKRAALTPDAPAHFTQKEDGAWRPTSWSELADVIERVAAGLANLGLSRNERVVILAGTSQDWDICQIAALQLGATVIGIDPYYPADQANQMIAQLKPAALIAGNESLLQRVDPALRAALRFVLLIGEPVETDGVISVRSLKQGHETPARTVTDPPVRGDDPAIIAFSSGTTGVPKPIVYTHAQVCLACRAILEAFDDIEEGCNLVCWMPLANSFQRIINFCAFIKGSTTYFVEDPRQVMKCVPVANPYVFIAVPTFCERLYAGINENLSRLPRPIGALIRGGIAANMRRNELTAAGLSVPFGTRFMAALARRTVLKPLRGVMGSKLRYIVSGSAPCPEWLVHAFAAIGIPVLEAYGQSEDIVPIAANLLSASKPGTVGRPLKYNEVRLSDAGVIQVRGPGVFHPDLAENAERPPLTPDGYLVTGDLGEFVEGGYLKLTGREGNVFKTANGRWVSPGVIEAALRRVPYVEQAAVLVRDGATILAIVVISAAGYARTRAGGGSGELNLADPLIQREIQADLTRELSALAPAIWPHGVVLTTRMFSIDGGELTSNLKLRHAVIDRKYDAALTRLRAEIDRAKSQPAQSVPTGLRVLAL
jgi:long-chain acyl-CoA synthetase